MGGAVRLRRERASLLIIDLQAKLVPAIAEHERILSRTILMMRAAETLGVPVLLTTQYRQGLGDVVPEVRAAAGDSEPVDKVTFSCLGCEGVTHWLESHPKRTQLVVAGIETHICVAQTVMDAVERGMAVHVLSDAVGARHESDHSLGLTRMERTGATLSSTEMAIYELLGRAATDEFRKILPLIVSADT